MVLWQPVLRDCLRRSGAGVVQLHQHCFLLMLLFSIILLSTLNTSWAATYPPIRSPQTCNIPKHNSTFSLDAHLFIENEEKTITFATSERPVHQLLTEIVAVLLRQVLGYAKINIHTIPADFNLNSSILFTSPLMHRDLKIHDSNRVYEDQIMIDLLVWSNPAKVSSLEHYDTTGYLGTGGSFGWFIPTEVGDTQGLWLDYWKTYAISSGSAVNKFYRTKEELAELAPLLSCSEAWCNEGVYRPERCRKNRCALLFVSDAKTGRFLPHQIEKQQLFVEVAVLGANLTPELVKRNLALPDGRSMLLFHWTPSLLLRDFNVTSVAFPKCTPKSDEHDYLCNYELHRFNKYVWAGLQQHAKEAFNALESVTINYDEIGTLLEEFANQDPGTSIASLACSWINKHYDTWSRWSFRRHEVNLKLVGIFPIASQKEPSNSASARTSLSVKDKFIAPGNVYAFFMAIEAINKDPTILADYKIDYYVLDGACESDLVMTNFINVINSHSGDNNLNTLIGIVGPACSDTVEPLAGVTKHYNMPIISYGAEGAIFTDKNQYPYFFRTIPENKIYRQVYHELFKEMGWKRIASLTEDGHRYSEYVTPLHELLEKQGMVFVMRKYIDDMESTNMESHLSFLREQRSTVIIGDFYENVARIVICQAYRSNMTALQGYVWFLPQWYSKDWFNMTNKSDVGCSTDDLLLALEGHMSLSYQYFGEDDQIMQENITVAQWRRNYTSFIKGQTQPSDYAGFTYDAVWSYAFALDKMVKQNKSFMGDLRSANSTEALIANLESLSFEGVSGSLSFRSSHSRLTDIVLLQFRGGRYHQFAKFHINRENISKSWLELDRDKIFWPGAEPKDKLEACFVEGFRYVLGVSCTTAIVLICLVFLSIIAIFPIACVFVIKRNYDRKVEEMQAQDLLHNCIFTNFTNWQISRERLVLNRKLGEGQSGNIFGGECNIDGLGWVAVAVKAPKSGSTYKEKVNFLNEASNMITLQHENIIKLLGVCTDMEPIYVIMEFMLHGDLRSYLLGRRNLVYNSNRNDNDEVSNTRLTSMVRDVAKGLQYLADHKYVHRDLASRNCLVSDNRTVKIGDFGMARLVYQSNYYRFSRSGLLPVRWMAPESIKEGVYTSKSDIWSYGVLLFEVITFGAYPFMDMSNNAVVEWVRDGNTLTPPPGIHPLLHNLLLQCWQSCSSRRPSAHVIIDTLTNNPSLISPSLDSPQTSVKPEAGNTATLQPCNPHATGIKTVPTTTSLSRRLSIHPPRASQDNLPHQSVSALHYSRQASMSSASSQNPSTGRHSSGGSASVSAGVPVNLAPAVCSSSNGRKRSMSGNMAVPPITCSLSDTTIGGPMSHPHHNTLDALNLSVSGVVMEEKSEDGDTVTNEEQTLQGGDAVVDDGGMPSGESSGYASTGTGTGGSNSSSKRTENYCGGCSAEDGPVQAITDPDVRLNSSSNSGSGDVSVDYSVFSIPSSNGRTNNAPKSIVKQPRVRRLNNPNSMFYLSDPNRTFDNSYVIIDDEGAIPLLPQVKYNTSSSSPKTSGSNNNIRLAARRRTPTPDFLNEDNATGEFGVAVLSKCDGNNSGSSSTSSGTTAASNA